VARLKDSEDIPLMLDVTTAKVTLRSGQAMPQIGLGVWQTGSGASAREAIRTAITLGYRHIDTAKLYGNEADVGAAVRESPHPIYVTTKLWNDDHGYDAALRAFDASMARLGLERVDLYLVHWPVAGKRRETWRAMERIAEDGRARAVGVSNYLVPHLEELLGYAKRLPEVNQIELHPFLQQRETRALCAKHGIVVQAYSPLTRGHRLDDPRLLGIASRTGRSPAQVILRWGIEEGHVILPKSVREGRLRENAALFDFALSSDDKHLLDTLDSGTAVAWDPRRQP